MDPTHFCNHCKQNVALLQLFLFAMCLLACATGSHETNATANRSAKNANPNSNAVAHTRTPTANAVQTVSSGNQTGRVWLTVCCGWDNEQWDAMLTEIAPHARNMTGLMPDGFLVSNEGQFECATNDTEALLANHSATVHQLGIRLVPMLAGAF